jgi:hypothetical protein
MEQTDTTGVLTSWSRRQNPANEDMDSCSLSQTSPSQSGRESTEAGRNDSCVRAIDIKATLNNDIGKLPTSSKSINSFARFVEMFRNQECH